MSTFEFKRDIKKDLSFVLECKGDISIKDLNYSFRINIENVEYGFPGKIKPDNSIFIEIPPLNRFLGEKLQTGKYQAFMEAYSDDFYRRIWKGTVKIEGEKKIQLESLDTEDIVNDSVEMVNIKEENTKIIEEDVVVTKQDVRDAKKKVTTNAIKSDIESLSDDCGAGSISGGFATYEMPVGEPLKPSKEEDDEDKDVDVIEESIRLPKWFK